MKNFKKFVLSSLEMKERNIRSENIVVNKLRRQFYLQNKENVDFITTKNVVFGSTKLVISPFAWIRLS